jgi:hypothetical protein
VIDAAGATLMPAWSRPIRHFSWNDAATLMEIQLMPLEEHVLWAASVRERYLKRAGPRASAPPCASRGSTWSRNAINEGLIPVRATSPRARRSPWPVRSGDETLPHIPAGVQLRRRW